MGLKFMNQVGIGYVRNFWVLVGERDLCMCFKCLPADEFPPPLEGKYLG